MYIFDTDKQSDIDILLGKGPVGSVARNRAYGSIPGMPVMGDYPDALVSKNDYKEVIEYCHREKIFSYYHQANSWCPKGKQWNQNGLGYCHDDETEVLTTRGWLKWGLVQDQDLLGTVNPLNHQLEFQSPLLRQTFEYEGRMIYSSNRRIDFGVTPNHRMYVRKWNEPNRTLDTNYSFVDAGNLGWYTGLLHAPSGFLGTELLKLAIPGDREYIGDNFISLIALILSDGYAGHPDKKTKNWVSFCCFDEKRLSAVRYLASITGFTESVNRPGVFTRYSAGSLAQWVRINCYENPANPSSIGKKIPEIFKWISEKQITRFLSWYGDQDWRNPMSMYFSISKRMVDDLQELLLRIGKRSTPSWRDKRTTIGNNGHIYNSKELCSLVISSTDRLCLDKKKHIEEDSYKGQVFCATVPNGTLVTRRNETTLISGNCWAWGITAALMDQRAREGKETKELSPLSLGWLVGWKNRGNYLESAVKGLTERGVCEASFVPDQHDPDPRRFKSGWEENALQYRLHEGAFWDTDNSSKETMIQHCITGLRAGNPVYVAYNWWGHALEVIAVEWDESKVYNLIWWLRNSHNESDIIKMEGNKAVPSEAYILTATEN